MRLKYKKVKTQYYYILLLSACGKSSNDILDTSHELALGKYKYSYNKQTLFTVNEKPSDHFTGSYSTSDILDVPQKNQAHSESYISGYNNTTETKEITPENSLASLLFPNSTNSNETTYWSTQNETISYSFFDPHLKLLDEIN